MRKRYSSIVIVMSLILLLTMVFAISSSSAANLIYYENFEGADENTKPVGWSGGGTITSSEAREGKKSFFIEDADTARYVEVVSPFIPVSGYTTYTAALWAKTDNVVNDDGRIAALIEEYSNTTTREATHWIWFPQDRPLNWTFGSVSFTTKSTTTMIRIRLYPAGGAGVAKVGKAWFDAVQVVQGKNPLTLSQLNQ